MAGSRIDVSVLEQLRAVQDSIMQVVASKHHLKSALVQLGEQLGTLEVALEHPAVTLTDADMQTASELVKAAAIMVQQVRSRTRLSAWVKDSRVRSSMSNLSYRIQQFVKRRQGLASSGTFVDDTPHMGSGDSSSDAFEHRVSGSHADDEEDEDEDSRAYGALTKHGVRALAQMLSRHVAAAAALGRPHADTTRHAEDLLTRLFLLRQRLFELRADEVASERVRQALRRLVDALVLEHRAVQEKAPPRPLARIRELEVLPARRALTAALNSSADLHGREEVEDEEVAALTLSRARQLLASGEVDAATPCAMQTRLDWELAREAGARFLAEPMYAVALDDMHRMVDASIEDVRARHDFRVWVAASDKFHEAQRAAARAIETALEEGRVEHVTFVDGGTSGPGAQSTPALHTLLREYADEIEAACAAR